MVMEASPSPQSVGREFVRQYYTLLNKAPAHLHRFYNNYSSFVHGGLDAPNRETLPVVGQKQIHNRIQQLNFRDCHAKISQVDSQATLGAGVVVQVTGELSNAGAPMRRFTQTFVLAAQSPKKYYVHNDIFRYQDIVFSDEEGEGDGRSSGSEEEARGYFPPPAFPPPPPAPALAALPAQAPAPATAPAPAPAPLQEPPINGHPLHHDFVTALHSSGAPGGGEPEPAAEPEPAGDAPPEPAPAPAPAPTPTPTPAPQPPQTPQQAPPTSGAAGAGPEAPPEPKTYANLLKSSAAPLPPRAAPPHAHAERPRPPRAPRDAPQPPPPGDSAGGGGGGGTGAALGGRTRYADAQQLFLGNVPVGAAEDELRAFFSRFGPVAELRVHSKAAGAVAGGSKHPNYGFITYESARGAGACLAAAGAAPLLFGAPPDQVKLNVEEKKARARDPRRRPPSAAPAPPRPYRR